jgi:hypothetical protein
MNMSWSWRMRSGSLPAWMAALEEYEAAFSETWSTPPAKA